MLTTEEKLKVLCMYFGAETELIKINEAKIETHLTILNIDRVVSEGIKLKLNLLANITDEHAIEVAKLFYKMAGDGIGSITYSVRKVDRIVQKSEKIIVLYNTEESLNIYKDTGEVKFKSHKGKDIHLMGEYSYYSRELLKSLGYAVPIFFKPNHPLNNKTAIDLGIATIK